MNIVVNAVLSYEKPRGVGRYINNLLNSISEMDETNDYFIYYGSWMNNYDFLKINKSNFHFIKLDINNKKVSRNLYLACVLPIICKKYNPDLFFLIDTQAILFKPCKTVSTIHDLMEFSLPEKYSKIQAISRKLIVKHQVRISDSIITVSEYSKNEIVKKFNINKDLVNVVYTAIEFKNESKLSEPEKYFLFVSETERAKNLMLLIEAFELLPNDIKEKYHIEVVGANGNDYQNILKKISEYNLNEKVHFNGYVDDATLQKYYQNAYAFIFPSIYEGFGLPVLEAMAKGAPVLCSNAASIPEAGGDAVITFDPYDANDLCKSMQLLIRNPELRSNMIEKGFKRVSLFTKEKMAHETLNVFSKAKETC
jgi:glycosyltransferase involved in cell wall biosynthesis